MKVVYVTCPPGLEETAVGFAMAQPAEDLSGEPMGVKVCVRMDCPPGKIYLTDKPLPEPYERP